MNILITAGSTQIPIDKVRIISNIFKGKTGMRLAVDGENFGHNIVLLANPNAKDEIEKIKIAPWYKSKLYNPNIRLKTYKTFDDLHRLMEYEIINNKYDCIIHSAAVSDYKVLNPVDGKISSGKEELVLKLTPTIKLVDQIREPWGFKGILVKFKLEVGVDEDTLIQIAKKSRAHSSADYIVANSFEFFDNWDVPKMFIIDSKDNVSAVSRYNLSKALFTNITGDA